MSDEKEQLVNLNVNGVDYKVPGGMNLVDAMESIGKEVPHYCYHPKLSVSGNCRMCLVEMGMPMRDRATGDPVLDDDGNPKIGFFPKPAIACSTKVSPNLHIKTDTEMVKGCREGVMEFLLVNHPLDCPICDQAGECRLQEFSTDYGKGYSRFVEQKNVKPKRTRLGPRVTLDDERCILCSRCIRMSKEVAGEDVLGFVDRGSYSTLTCYPGRELDHNYSLNTVDICPVGALTSTDFRFKMRVWFLKPVKSICTESSVGANTEVWSREGKIYRVTPRRNDAVNDTWMSDSGRDLYKQVESENRLKEYQIKGETATPEAAIKEAAALLATGKVAYVGSGHMSVEEQYLMSKLRDAAKGEIHYFHHEGEGDELLISSDRTPNLRGALVTGIIDELPVPNLVELSAKIDGGHVDTILSWGEGLIVEGLTESQLEKVKIIYIGRHSKITSEKAAVVLPALTVFEKSGTFINQQFRIQKFHKAVPGPEGLVDDCTLVSRILGMLQQKSEPTPNLTQLWAEIAESVPALKDLSFARIPDEGVLIDAAKWENLTFCEGKTLHYEPKTAEATA